MKREFIKQLIPSLLIFLFAYTAVSKLSDFDFFRTQLSLYPFIKEASLFIAIAIPVTELVTALLLFFPSTRYTGLYASLVLLILFTGYLFMMVVTQSNLPCSCGGVIEKMSWQQHIAFNFFFIFLSAAGILIERYQKPLLPVPLTSHK